MSLDAEDIAEFERAVTDLLAAVNDDTDLLAERLETSFNVLSESGLPVDEMSRRARRIVSRFASISGIEQAVAAAARPAAPAVRTAAVAELPPEWQRAAYTETSSLESLPREERALGAEPARAVPTSAEVPPQDDPADVWRTVLLLGDRDEVEPNAQLLRSRNFKSIKVTSLGQLPDLHDESCCGIVIHRGWWRQFESPEAMVSFVRRQLDFASIPNYRIDSEGLGDGALALVNALNQFDASTRSRVVTSLGSVVGDADFARFDNVASLLKSADDAHIVVEGLADSERRLLASAIALFEGEERGRLATRATDLIISPLIDGRSNARVFRIRSESGASLFVAKIDALARLQEEVARARTIAPPGPAPAMAYYSLAGTAVLIQRLFTNLDAPLEGAPSLRERLATRSAWERGRRAAGQEPLLSDLEKGLDRLISLVQELNIPNGEGVGVYCWTKVEPLSHLADLGIHWKIETDDGDFDPAELLGWVEAKVSELGDTCLVHGDLHAGNVLMIDDRTPRLIDFAAAGGGHPCFDLVRLSSAIAYSTLRPVANEHRLREFFDRAHVKGATPDKLADEFPDLIANSGARLAARALSLTREAAYEALGSEEDDAEGHYLAMVYLIGAQTLTMDDYQGAAVRAALGAVHPRLATLAGN